MAWTNPATITVGQLITADFLNEQVRDNLLYLFERPHGESTANEANFSTSSESFVNVDQSGANVFELQVVTSGGDLLVGFTGCIIGVASSADRFRGSFDVTLDGVRVGDDDGIITIGDFRSAFVAGGGLPVNFTRRVGDGVLAAGTHTLILQWRARDTTLPGSATMTLYAGAGASYDKSSPQLWAIEV